MATKITESGNLIGFKEDDVFIAVMGLTGAGKSTFISKCCTDIADIIGHSLWSHTSKCANYTFSFKDKNVHLIDTPGFDDSRKSSTDVLREIASWLVFAYQQNIRLDGLIYLHGINESRVKGSQMINLRMFKKMTGLNNMASVVFATTMWDKTPSEDATRREQELLTENEFWGEMIQAGANVKRFKNDTASAHAAIGVIVENPNRKFVPNLQQQMAVEDRHLDQTDAGKTLNVELTETKEMYARQMKEQESQLQQALRDKDTKYAQEVMNMQDKLAKEMERLATNQKELQVSNAQLLKEKEEEIKRTRKEMDQMRQNIEDRDRKHAGEMAKMQEANRETEDRMKKEMSERFTAEMDSYRENLTERAAAIVENMDSFYADLNAKRAATVEEEVSKLKAIHAAQQQAPPPYAAYPPGYFPPPPRQRGDESSFQDTYNKASAVGAGVVGGTLLGAAALSPFCVVM